MREYIVTLRQHDDLESFYEDMEYPGGPFYLPDRCTSCVNRRPVSRNTHYMLTDEEAVLLEQDPRVENVSLPPAELGLHPTPFFEQTSSNWNKNNTNNSAHRNWGLLRCFEQAQRSNWGSNGTVSQTGTVNIPGEGRDVDVVIVDGHFFDDHPEFSNRFVAYNWFSLNPEVNPSDGRTVYEYTPVVDAGNPDRTADNNHGAHVAGTAVGSLQGWARSANIYCLNLYSTSNNPIASEVLFDYIREFHRIKPVNPATGRKNPTIVNNSWGFAGAVASNTISSVQFRGVTYTSPFTEAQLREDYGIMAGVRETGTTIFLGRVPAVDADLLDAVNEGIIMVGAAGNDSYYMDVPGGDDFNNRLFIGSSFVYYHRGGSPSSSPGSICVGAIGTTVNEAKATFSNCGPRVDIYAPGVSIISSLNSGGVADSRDSSFRTGKFSGTSMACPQVTGVLACALETNPQWTPSQALDYLVATSGKDQITDTGGGFADFTSLQGSPNRYLAFRAERPPSGATFPRLTVFIRPVAGATFPRTRIRR